MFLVCFWKSFGSQLLVLVEICGSHVGSVLGTYGL
jgi:hypothetical protein